ncbi:MAG TPA: hypothetical protein VFH06_03915 [Candidatus Saccharimonadales bacterium]|nr:hypothetical protein [Candidatus Saccharimonadales bacterium]
MAHPQEEELLSYDDLLAYTSSTIMYDQSHATRLWITMTAFLPISDPECFIVITSAGNRLTPRVYKAWFDDKDPRPDVRLIRRRNTGVEERMKWRVGRRLIELFEQEARPLSPSEISEYGPASRALMVDWISHL